MGTLVENNEVLLILALIIPSISPDKIPHFAFIQLNIFPQSDDKH